MQQDHVQHVERIDRSNALDQRSLTVPVQRLQSETTSVDLATLAHEFDNLVVHGHVTRKCFAAELGKAALNAERHAGPVQEDGRFETFAQQARRLQQVDEPNRALKGYG